MRVQKNRRDGLSFTKACLVHQVCMPQQYERLAVNSGLTEGTSSQLAAAPSAGLKACFRGRRTPYRREASQARGGARRGSPVGAPTAPGRHLAPGAAPVPLPAAAQPRRAGPGGHFSAALPPADARLPGLRGLSFNRPPSLEQAAQTRCQPAAASSRRGA